MKKLTDEDVITFGKFKGKKLANVPAHYLLWVNENMKGLPDLKIYIRDNMEVLQKEANKKKS